MSDWPVTIDGETYHPVPPEWVNHPNAVDESPAVDERLYAVSVSGVADGFRLRIRYADRRENVWTAEQDAIVTDSGKIVPRALNAPIDQWARSKTASPRETNGVLRKVEIDHFETLWGDRLAADRRAVADGGGKDA